MFAISPTDKTWFHYQKHSNSSSNINFWTPTPWNIRRLKNGERLYFMLKSPIRKIGGYGEFFEYKNLTTIDAWNEFGYRNGRSSRQEFINSIQEYIDKNSLKFGRQLINIDTYKIGCIVLNNCQFWDEDQFIDLKDFNIEFATQVVTIKYFEDDPFKKEEIKNENFNLISQQRSGRRGEVNIRDGQSEFKAKIHKAYNNQCCISGEIIPELLEASHIQGYKNISSNHVQNGLLLRVDIHRLFDNELLFIDKHYVVHISNLITNGQYRQYDGLKISLPNSTNEHPSKIALESRRNLFRNS